jgi:histidine phosphotransferase ChpT
VISNVWQIQAKAEKLKIEVALWEQLKSDIAANGLAPAHIQFALLPAELSRQGRRPETMVTADTVTIRY